MKKRRYIGIAAALLAGVMITACTGKTDVTGPATESKTVAESSSGSEENGSSESTLQDETLSKAYEAVKAAYGDNYIPSMLYDETSLKELFGISPELYDDVIAEGPMISVNVETFIGVKAKEGKSEEVASALEDYRKKQSDEAVQYPMNMVKLEASQVVTKGDYVFFLMLGSADQAAEEKGEKEALESAKINNQIAVDAVNAVFEK